MKKYGKPTLKQYSDGLWVCSYKKYDGLHGFSRQSPLMAFYKLKALVEILEGSGVL